MVLYRQALDQAHTSISFNDYVVAPSATSVYCETGTYSEAFATAPSESASARFDVTITVQPVGDIDGDGRVGFSDLLTLAQNYGQAEGASYATGDINMDGKVDFADLLSLAQNYGQNLTAAQMAADVRGAFVQVPEPGLCGIAAVGFMAILVDGGHKPRAFSRPAVVRCRSARMTLASACTLRPLRETYLAFPSEPGAASWAASLQSSSLPLSNVSRKCRSLLPSGGTYSTL